jgi:hypothetical protein
MQDPSIFYRLPQISIQPPGIKWIVDPKLQRYINRLDTPHVDLIAYHLVTTAPSPNSNGCLTAFLAHIALIPAHRLRSTHAVLQQHYTEDLADVYQIGMEIVSDPRGFLSNFDPSRSLDTGYWYPNLYRWSQQKFDRFLTDKIRNQKGMSGFKRTNLSLVARATATKIVKALTQQGYSPATHPTYLAVHFCLRSAVKAKRFSTAQPQAADYAEILALYRQLQVTPLDLAQITSHLDRLETAASNYDRMRLQSIDLPIGEDSDRTILDTITDDRNPLDTAILAEYQQQVDRLKQIIIKLLQQLPIERDRLLLLLYGLDLTQKQTGAEISRNQTTVMHRRDKLLSTLAEDIYHKKNSEKLPALSSEHLKQIVIHSIAFYQQYYPGLLFEISRQLVNINLHNFVERVQLRWEIQFHPEGAAIDRLRKIVESDSEVG